MVKTSGRDRPAQGREGRRAILTTVAAAAACLAGVDPAAAEFRPCERPFIFMDREEIEGAKRRWAAEAWAPRAFDISVSHAGDGTDKAWPFHDAFRVMVLGDEDLAQKEKARLMSFAGADVSQTPPREDRLADVIRYDMLYDRLTPKERQAIEDAFRAWIRYQLHEYWRGRETYVKEEGQPPWDTRYSRVDWLPNMLYPRAQGIFMMALALQDEALIRECFATPVAGFKWWMDHYVADGHFYMGDAGSTVMIQGHAATDTVPEPRWYSARMNGPIPRMRTPLWFEIAHAQWPDAGFDWVLAQMRMPQDDRYYPSLFFNLPRV